MKIKFKSLILLLCLALTSIPNQVYSSENNPFPTDKELEKLSPSNRRVLLEYIADREAQKASENPDAYNKKVKDITLMQRAGAMTGEMAKFYLAVAVLEFSHCLQTGDATKCTQFMESLKDPIGHIGFAIFMKGNKMTIDMAQFVTRGRINPGMASYMGLAGGMMAQTVFQDLYYHPLTQELLKNSGESNPELRRKNRKVILNKIWSAVKEDSGKYLIEKIPHVSGLLGAAYLSHKTMQLMGYGAGKFGKVVTRFKTDSTTGKVLMEISDDMKKTRSLRASSSRVAFKWVNNLNKAKKYKNAARILRLNPVVALGSYVVETVVFLMWAPIVEDILVKKWDQSKVRSELKKAKEGLKPSEGMCVIPSVLEEKAQRVSSALDKWRETIMHKANTTKMRHLMEINKIDVSYQKLAMYYAWLVEGADLNSEYYQANELSWHKDFIVHQVNESTDVVEDFFCGVSSDDAVKRKVSYHGAPYPGSESFDYNYDDNRTLWENMQANDMSTQPREIVLSNPRVLRVPGTCDFDMRTVSGGEINFWTHGRYEDVICPLDFDMTNQKINWGASTKPKLHCELELSWARKQILQSKMLKGKNIEEKLYIAYDQVFGKMMAKIWGQRDLMIMNYESAVRYELVKGLTGLKVEIDQDDSVVASGSFSYNGEHANGFIPHLVDELAMWQDMKRNADDVHAKDVYAKMAKQTQAKIVASKQLLTFIKKPYQKRVREIDTDMFEEVEPGEWQQIIRTLREYVVN